MDETNLKEFTAKYLREMADKVESEKITVFDIEYHPGQLIGCYDPDGVLNYPQGPRRCSFTVRWIENRSG